LAGQTPDYREGVRAFLAKRQPRFTEQPRRPDAAGGTLAFNHQN